MTVLAIGLHCLSILASILYVIRTNMQCVAVLDNVDTCNLPLTY